MEQEFDRLIRALSRLRIPQGVEEYDIHREIGRALDAAGIDHVHEARLGPRRRIDFLAGDIGIEVKRGRPDRALLLKQIGRYLEGGGLSALVVVCQREVSIPGKINDKKVAVLSLNRLWGLALP